MSELGPPPVPGGRSAEERERARLEREARRSGRPAADGDGSAPPPAPRPVARDPRLARRPLRSGGQPRAVRRIAAGLLLVALLALVWFLGSLFQPFKGEGSGRVQVVIPKGVGLAAIAGVLHGKGVVSSEFFFKLRTRLAGHSGDLKPGLYQLKRDMSYGSVFDALTKGVRARTITLTIPEGRARREVAPLVRAAGLSGVYLAATARSPVLNPRRYGAPGARNLEGFLFPATYQLGRGASARGLVKKQLRAFTQAFAKVGMRAAKRRNLTAYDVLIIASMVEREASAARDRPLIASVIYNRLKQGIPLGIDATIRYATGNWTRPLKQSELQIRSGYNTRTNQGLPPGPIGNPGLASIKAAAHPARTSYLFFVVKPCGKGEHVFSSTDAQFRRDVRRYNTARAEKGGNSPANCK